MWQFGDELKAARADRDALIAEVVYAVKHPAEVFGSCACATAKHRSGTKSTTSCHSTTGAGTTSVVPALRRSHVFTGSSSRRLEGVPPLPPGVGPARVRPDVRAIGERPPASPRDQSGT